MVTKEQLAGGLMVIKAVADAIKGAGQIPAGTLYAALNSMELLTNCPPRFAGSTPAAGFDL